MKRQFLVDQDVFERGALVGESLEQLTVDFFSSERVPLNNRGKKRHHRFDLSLLYVGFRV